MTDHQKRWVHRCAHTSCKRAHSRLNVRALLCTDLHENCSRLFACLLLSLWNLKLINNIALKMYTPTANQHWNHHTNHNVDITFHQKAHKEVHLIYLRIHLNVHMNLHMNVQMNVHINVHMYVHINIHIWIFIKLNLVWTN